MGLLEVLVHFVLVCVPVAFFAIRYRYNYWRYRGIPCIDAVFPYGSVKDLSLFHGINSKYYEVYEYLSRNFIGGIYIFLNPVAVVTEPKWVEKTLIEKADHFEVDDLNLIESDEITSAYTLLLEDKKWSYLKKELIPKFLPQVESMVPDMAGIAKRVNQSLRATFKFLPVLKVGDFASRYAIGATGYTLFDIRSLDVENPDSEIYLYEKPGVPTDPKNDLYIFAEKFYKFCTRINSNRNKFRVPHDAEVFYKAIKETVERRMNLNTDKADLIDLLLKAKNQSKDLTTEEIINQAFRLFVALHETTSATLTLALYELAINQEIQDKLREEIRAILKKYNGKITYEAIMEMHYMDLIVSETLRKYPPIPNLFRKTIKPLNWAKNRTIEKNISVIIPIAGIHMDKHVHNYPEVFDPERFSPENIRKKEPYAYLPFGEKNDYNIGQNIVKVQVFIGLVQMLENIKFIFCQRTHIPLEVDKKTLVATVKDDVVLRLKELPVAEN